MVSERVQEMELPSKIAQLLQDVGCSCAAHPDDMPAGARRCLACQAEEEWRGLLLWIAGLEDGVHRLEAMAATVREQVAAGEQAAPVLAVERIEGLLRSIQRDAASRAESR